MAAQRRASGLSVEQERAWRGYLRAHALLVRRLDQDLREQAGMTLTGYDALVQLSEAPDRRLRMTELAEALVYSASGVTRVVDTLERAGHAARERDPRDRRALQVVLTPEGLAALKGAWPVHVAGVSAHWAAHVDDDLARLLAESSARMVSDLE